MTDLNVKTSVQIPAGPTVQSIRTVTVDAYEAHTISLPPNSSNDAGIELSFLPSGGSGKVNVLFIQSNFYTGEKDGGELLFTMGKIADKPLREPLVLLGTEVIEVLGPPEKITFKNTYPTKKVEEADTPADGGDSSEEGAAAPKEIDVTEENTAQISILIGRVNEG